MHSSKHFCGFFHRAWACLWPFFFESFFFDGLRGVDRGAALLWVQSWQLVAVARESEVTKLPRWNTFLTEWSELNTHSNSMCRCAQCVTTYTEQNDHISSREHAWLKRAQAQGMHIFVAQNNCHKFSLTYLTYLSDVLSLTPKSFGARSIFTLPRSTAEWRIH